MHGMAALQAANILEQDERSGRRARWRLTPVAFGQHEPALRQDVRTQGDQSPQKVSPLATELPEPETESQNITIHVAGLSLSVPIGTHVHVVVDAIGRRSYHIGDDLIVGPVA
jgi:hypothetical protein